MSNLTKLTVLTFAALASAISLGSSPASASGCDGTWMYSRGHRQVQCYYLPTVSNGRVTGLERHENTRDPGTRPGAIIGSYPNVIHHYPSRR